MTISNILAKFPRVNFIDHKKYHTGEFDHILKSEIPGDMSSLSEKGKWRNVTKGTSKLIRQACSYSVLTHEQEQFLFQRLNLCRFKANDLREKIVDGVHHLACEFQQTSMLGMETRNIILNHNMRLTVSHLMKKGELHLVGQRLGGAVLTMMNAVDKFDWSKGNKFSTYLSCSLTKSYQPWHEENISRLVTKHINVNVFSGESMPLENIIDHRNVNENFRAIKAVVSSIEKVEKENLRLGQILRWRFNVDGRGTLTLDEIGKRLSLSAERIRQLSNTAMDRLKEIARTQYPEFIEEEREYV